MPTDHIKSEKRVAAGHLNGLKAKGTKTPEGKSRSALNAVKHGLGAKRIVLANENFAEFERLMDMFMTRFQPVDGVEYELIADVVVAKWRHRRACGIEAAAVDLQLEKDRPQQDRDYIELSEDIRCALAYQAVERETGFISAMNRHGARIYREFHNGMKLLVQMQANRPAPAPPQNTLPNEGNEDLPEPPSAGPELATESDPVSLATNTSPNEGNQAPCGPAPDDVPISQHTRSPQPEPRAPASAGGIAAKTYANRLAAAPPQNTPTNEGDEVHISEHKTRRFQLP
jgi:hypothetical protein